MKKRFIALGFYTLYWLVFFFAARVFFIIFQYQLSFRFTTGELLATFLHGARLDISTTAYYLIIPVLLAIPGIYLEGSWYRYVVRWYTFIMIAFSSLIIVSDAVLYSYWGFRMDYTPFFYLRTPAEAMASVTTSQLAGFLSLFVVIAVFFIFLYQRLIDSFFSGFKRVSKWILWMLVFLVLFASLIIPIRGGFGIAPINAGSVYFSRKMFLNHTAINAVWNVGTSAVTQKPVDNPYKFGDLREAEALVSMLTEKKGIPEKVLNTSRPNIMIILLESFSGYFVGELGGDSLATPNLNRYAREGILFDNFYASGNRTDKAIPAVLSGYPSLPALSIIKEPKKSQTLPNIVRMLSDSGYFSSFWYGGEINFANFNSYVIGSGFRQIITMDNFPSSDYNSKWGVHDHIMFNALADSMVNLREPFVSFVLTLSSHEPFDIPVKPHFEGNSNLVKYKNSIFYADSALGEFLDRARETRWWRNTLVIMVADHCGRYSAAMPIYTREAFRIPMVWTGGAVSKSGMRVNKFGCQTDIPVTIAGQLGLPATFPFGKDLLSGDSHSFAFYAFNDGFGFVTDSSAVAFDNKVRKPVMMEGSGAEIAERSGKSYLQVLFDDYLRR